MVIRDAENIVSTNLTTNFGGRNGPGSSQEVLLYNKFVETHKIVQKIKKSVVWCKNCYDCGVEVVVSYEECCGTSVHFVSRWITEGNTKRVLSVIGLTALVDRIGDHESAVFESREMYFFPTWNE